MDNDSGEDSIVRGSGRGDESAKNGYDGSAVGDERISAVRDTGGSDRGWCGWRGQGDLLNYIRGGGDFTVPGGGNGDSSSKDEDFYCLKFWRIGRTRSVRENQPVRDDSGGVY